MYIRRAIEPLVKSYSEHFKAVVVTGPRQVGKTTMLKHLMDEDARQGKERDYVTLDDIAALELAKSDPALFLQRYKPPILIDEIQKAPELLPCIKSIVDGSDETGLFWLTGSQPLHLMKEVSESLAGRVGVIEMLGFSNSEISATASEPFNPSEGYFARRVKAAAPYDVEEAYRRMAAGSLPAISRLPDALRPGGWDSYIDTYLMRDIRDLSQVGDELKFRRFLAACAAHTARPVVYAELARIADIDEKTAKAWLSLLVSSHLVKIITPYSNNLLKRLSKQPIMHFTDTGLAAHLAGWESPRALEVGAMSGQILETFAFCEVYKSFINAGKKPPLFFFRNNDKKEIDLIVEREGAIHPVEVKRTALPRKDDVKNFSALAPLSADDIPAELASLKREVGTGCVVCLTQDAYPISRSAWAFPLWAI